MKKSLIVSFIATLVFAATSCTSMITVNKSGNKEQKVDYDSMFANAEKSLSIATPTSRTKKDPLVMVHYMPWFQAPPVSEGYGFHWHQGGAKFNPYDVLPNGQANIASHYYPLTGPYDTRDTDILEYQCALMKVSGIDGVIFDWYGIENALDYADIQESTIAMIKVLKKAGLKFIICYEDQSMGKMVEAGLFQKSESVEYGKKVFKWMQDNWFTDDAYVKYEGRPVIMNFGPQYFKDKGQWDEIFSVCKTRPYFISLEGHSDGFVEGSYNWFNMNGKKTISQVVSQLNNFYARQYNKPYLVATAYGGFHDIYGQTGQTSYGYLDYCDGKTFNLTLDASLRAYPDVIQVATWNDYGEGTVIEPTVQNGYKELEAIQEMQKEFDPNFAYETLDIRAPIALFKCIRDDNTPTTKKNAARRAMDAILQGNAESYRSIVSSSKISIDYAVHPILKSPTRSLADTSSVSVFDAGGRKNLALGAPIVANNKIYDFVGSKCVDGDINTYWEGAANKYPNEVTVDLIVSQMLDSAVLKLNPQQIWGKRVQIIEVQTSVDGNNFEPLIPATEYKFNPTENKNTVAIPLNVKARYVRFVITKNTGGNAGQIAELEIYASK